MGFDTSAEPIEIAKNQWYNFPNIEYRRANWNNIKVKIYKIPIEASRFSIST